MQGEYWMQEPRLHIAKFLKEHVEKAVRLFRDTSKAKRLPEHVIVFRTGVSEGEYEKVGGLIQLELFFLILFLCLFVKHNFGI